MRARILLYVCIFLICRYTYHYMVALTHASDISHVLIGVSMTYVTNHVLLCVMCPHLFAK